MKKRLFTLFAAMALTLSLAMPVMQVSAVDNPPFDEATDVDGSKINSQTIRKWTNYVIGEAENLGNSSNIKVSGPSNVKVSVVFNDDRDNLHENGITPFVRESVKAYFEDVSGIRSSAKIMPGDIDAIYYFNLSADEPGQVTFKLDDGYITPGGYAVVMRYTGNPQDQDGMTAQYVKIGSGGRVTANFNGYSPVAIIATSVESAQKMANTYYLAEGSDQMGLFAATVNAGMSSPVLIVTGAAVVLIVLGTVVWKKKKKA